MKCSAVKGIAIKVLAQFEMSAPHQGQKAIPIEELPPS
jgi:hypothetical protein